MTWRLLQGDALEQLRALPEGSVQCCITSPPYLGLRSYILDDDALKPFEVGLEETPEKYIERLVAIFAGVWRVLRDDGTLWIVIGDSYARNSGKGQHKPGDGTAGKHTPVYDATGRASAQGIPAGMKEKDLIGVPWMLAFALRDAGWYLRSEIVWAKSISGPVYRGGSCMPEAVKDRCTKSHETIFMLSKRERYFFDHEAIKEPSVEVERVQTEKRRAARMSCGVHSLLVAPGKFGQTSKGIGGGAQVAHIMKTDPSGRNMRSVWHFSPAAFKGAHFATFPEKLVAPMVLAGSRPGDLVLDPFAGAGTTLLVAAQHGRSAIGIELNPEYIKLAEGRLKDVAPVAREEPDEPVDYSRVCWGEDEDD